MGITVLLADSAPGVRKIEKALLGTVGFNSGRHISISHKGNVSCSDRCSQDESTCNARTDMAWFPAFVMLLEALVRGTWRRN